MSDNVQLALLDSGRARHDSPATSREAAAAVDVPRRCAEVLAALADWDEPVDSHRLTFDLLRRGHEWAMPNTVARRLTDLERKALAVRVDEVPGRFGRNVTRWRAA